MNNELQILTKFKKALILFFDQLIDCLPDEGNLVIIRIFLKDRIPIMDVMNIFVNRLLPLKSIVQTRNDSFFLENDELFSALNADNVNHFKTIWSSGKLDSDDKQCIWVWFDSFIDTTEEYVQCKNS